MSLFASYFMVSSFAVSCLLNRTFNDYNIYAPVPKNIIKQKYNNNKVMKNAIFMFQLETNSFKLAWLPVENKQMM